MDDNVRRELSQTGDSSGKVDLAGGMKRLPGFFYFGQQGGLQLRIQRQVSPWNVDHQARAVGCRLPLAPSGHLAAFVSGREIAELPGVVPTNVQVAFDVFQRIREHIVPGRGVMEMDDVAIGELSAERQPAN